MKIVGWEDRDYASANGYQQAIGRRFPRLPTGMLLNTQLIVLNAVIYLVGSVIGPRQMPLFIEWGAMSTADVLHGQIWRLITSQYLHAGIGHLFLNMLALYFLGHYLERYWGRARYFVVYTCCGLAGNVFLMVLNLIGWLPYGLAVGASGCILGVLGACAVLFPQIRLIVYFFPMKIRTAAVLFLVLYVANLVERGWNAGGDAAHLAGLLVGVGYAWWRGHGGAHRSQTVSVVGRPVMGPGAWQRKLDADADLSREVDRILAKIQNQGIASLTETEKQILAQASALQRRVEQQFGRTDRL